MKKKIFREEVSGSCVPLVFSAMCSWPTSRRLSLPPLFPSEAVSSAPSYLHSFPRSLSPLPLSSRSPLPSSLPLRSTSPKKQKNEKRRKKPEIYKLGNWEGAYVIRILWDNFIRAFFSFFFLFVKMKCYLHLEGPHPHTLLISHSPGTLSFFSLSSLILFHFFLPVFPLHFLASSAISFLFLFNLFPSDTSAWTFSNAIDAFIRSFQKKFPSVNLHSSQLTIPSGKSQPSESIPFWENITDGQDVYLQYEPLVSQIVTCHHYGCGEKYDKSKNSEVNILRHS